MLRVILPLACCLAIASAGCSAVVSPDTSRFDERPAVMLPDSGAPSTDAGSVSPGPSDAGSSPVDPGPTDAGAPEVDAGPSCTAPPRCEGDVAIACVDGALARQDCQAAGKLCEAGACVDRLCEPGALECSRDFTASLVCDERGALWVEQRCPFGCDPATGGCSTGPSPVCAALSMISVGETQRFTLCGARNATSYVGQMGSDCNPGSDADSGEVMRTLRIATRGTYVIDLRDVDLAANVDTVVYLRRACDAPETQIGCDDDVPCSESDISSGCSGTGPGAVQVRQSRLEVTLEPGTYYVVADAFLYWQGATAFSCGYVELKVEQRL